MKVKQKFQFTRVTVDEIFIWLKKQIRKGKYKEYFSYTDKQIYELAEAYLPAIKIKLDALGDIALEQLNNSEKTALVKSKAPLPLTQS